MKTSLVIQSFGRENEYRRAVLTILSFYAHSTLKAEQTQVVLFTDKPGYFAAFLDGLPVQYILLTAEKIKQMRGKIDFLHRMKIAVIEEAFSLADGPLVYTDSDTFFTADPAPLINELSPAKGFMHLWEYRFGQLRNVSWPVEKSFRDFVALIESRQFLLADGKQIKISFEQSSWNAGVMFFHPQHARYIADVYALTDQLFPPSLNHASEQYAFSVILQNNIKLEACDSVIYHYWYRIKKKIVDDFLDRKLSDAWPGLSMLEKLNEVKAWTTTLPAYFENHLWTYQDRALQAFNANDFQTGYRWTIKSFAKDPLKSKNFFKDVLYHTGRRFKLK